MTDRRLAQPPAQPAPDQVRATRETLEALGAPSDATAQDNQRATTHVDPTDLTQASVQPSAGVLNALPEAAGPITAPHAEANNRDSNADVVPR